MRSRNAWRWAAAGTALGLALWAAPAGRANEAETAVPPAKVNPGGKAKIPAQTPAKTDAAAEAAPGPAAWLEDFAAAKTAATQGGKDLLLDFTGSDWCSWCKKLDAEVFSTPGFTAEAPKTFVLVKLDFPRATPQAEALRKQNAELQTRYAIQGFPTILLADPTGRVYGKTGYQEGGPEKYLAHLSTLRTGRDELLGLYAAAEKAEGAAKAAALDQLAKALAARELPLDRAIPAEIVRLDVDGKAGLKAKYEVQVALQEIEQKVAEAARTGGPAGAQRALDEGLNDPRLTVEAKQRLTCVKANIAFNTGDAAGGLVLLKAALALAPESPIGKQLPQAITQVEAKLQAAGTGGAKTE